MSGKRRATDDRQIVWSWIDPEDVLRSSEARGGDVLYEAPDASRIVAARPPKLPRVRARRAAPVEPPSLGLPFGRRASEGRITCWSCGAEIAEAEVGRDPGTERCPGCGAFLPIV